MKTAIIDNGIDTGTLSLYAGQPVSLMVSGGEVVSAAPPSRVSHGGLCARVFAGQSGALPEVSIYLSRDSSHRSNVNDLSAALEWCSYNDIGLVSLSMGTTRPGDGAILLGTMEKLRRAGVVLVAAASNDCLITYPAALDSCIGVCHTYLPELETGRFAYLERPFDGIDVVTSPVDFPDLQLSGANSLSAAFVAGMICREFGGAADAEGVRRWLSERAQSVPAGWENAYLKEKMVRTAEHEAVVIACLDIPAERAGMFLEELRKYILCDGYTCAILAKRGGSRLSSQRFSLEANPMPPTEALELVTRLCRPSVILLDEWELAPSADVLVYNDGLCRNSSSAAALTCEFHNTTPDGLWLKVREVFEKKK